MNLEEKDMIQNPDIQADRPEDAVQKTPEAKAQRRPARKPAQRTNAVRREHRKESIDQIAAALILQGYLDSLAMKPQA